MKLMKLGGIVAGAFLMVDVASQGDVIVLDFEGLQDLESVNSYYNGGLGGSGSGPGPDFDLIFSGNSLAVIDEDAGGSGNIGGEPSPDTVLFFLSGTAILDVPNGFDTGFSFYYSSVNYPGVVTVYDGLGATGSVLATLNLPTTPFDGAPDPSGEFSPLVPFGAAFSGTALSIDFGGAVNQIVFDNITFGSDIPSPGGEVPEAGTTTVGALMLAGAFGLGLRRYRAGRA